jgi:hypothetical protein
MKSAASEIHQFITSSGLSLIQRAYPRQIGDPPVGWGYSIAR